MLRRHEPGRSQRRQDARDAVRWGALVLCALAAGAACTTLLGDFEVAPTGGASGTGGATTTATTMSGGGMTSAGGGGSGGSGASGGMGGSGAAGGTGGTGATGGFGGTGGTGGTGGSDPCPPLMGDCNSNMSDGCETNLNDDLHCGACFSRCRTVDDSDDFCNSGVCPQVTELWRGATVSDLDGNLIALDNVNVYWTPSVGSGMGSVLKVRKAGGIPTVLASNQAAPDCPATNGVTVFWAERNTNNVMRVEVDGDNLMPFVMPQAPPACVAVDMGYVYWTTRDGAGGPLSRVQRKLATCAGVIEDIASPLYPYGVAAWGNEVFWTERSLENLQRSLVTGGGITNIATGQGDLYYVTVDATNVYWTDHDGGVWMSPKVNPMAVLVGNNHQNPVAVAVDANHIYWTDESDLSVRRAPIGAPTVLEIIATEQPTPWGIAVDVTHVYWTTQAGDGSLRKMAKP